MQHVTHRSDSGFPDLLMFTGTGSHHICNIGVRCHILCHVCICSMETHSTHYDQDYSFEIIVWPHAGDLKF